MNGFETRRPSDSILDDVPFPGPHLSAFERQAQPVFVFAARLFGSFSFDELSQFLADMTNHLKKMIIRLPHFPAEEFDDPENVAAELDWKTEGGVQPFCHGGISTREVIFCSDIRNPYREPAAPDPAGQSGLHGKPGLPRKSCKVRHFSGNRMPDVHAEQLLGYLIDVPYRTHIPAGSFA